MTMRLSRRLFAGLLTCSSLAAAAGCGTRATNAIGATGDEQPSPVTVHDDGATGGYRFYSAGEQNKGLLVFLDGDGQNLYNYDYDGANTVAQGGLTGPGSIVEAAGSRGYDVVAVHTPSDDDTWWLLDHDGKIDYLSAVIAEVEANYGANTSRLWLVGYSGGSEFITQSFFPAYCERMTEGGFLVFAGGDAPSDEGDFSGDALSDLSLNWVTGSEDTSPNSSDGFDALGHARTSRDYYRAAGFEHIWEDWPDVTHSSVVDVFDTYVGRVLDDYEVL